MHAAAGEYQRSVNTTGKCTEAGPVVSPISHAPIQLSKCIPTHLCFRRIPGNHDGREQAEASGGLALGGVLTIDRDLESRLSTALILIVCLGRCRGNIRSD